MIAASYLVGSAGDETPIAYSAWTKCSGDNWYVGARYGSASARPFVWNEHSHALPRTPGLDAVQFLRLTPTAAPVIVVSTGTGYNWQTYDLFTVKRGAVVPFSGGQSSYPVQLRDSGGAGDFYAFTCARDSAGDLQLTQNQFGIKAWNKKTGNPTAYTLDSYSLLATSPIRLIKTKVRHSVVPPSAFPNPLAPSRLC
jgi:hypothetical protein